MECMIINEETKPSLKEEGREMASHAQTLLDALDLTLSEIDVDSPTMCEQREVEELIARLYRERCGANIVLQLRETSGGITRLPMQSSPSMLFSTHLMFVLMCIIVVPIWYVQYQLEVHARRARLLFALRAQAAAELGQGAGCEPPVARVLDHALAEPDEHD
jgi:hypothetical protein